MATKRKRGSTWYLDWRDPVTGRRERSAIGRITEEQAEAQRKLKEVELATGVSIFGDKAKISRVPLFDDYADDYIIWFRSQHPGSAKRVEAIIDTMRPFCRGLRLDQITPKLAKDIILARRRAPVRRRNGPDRAKTLSAGTVAKEFKAFKAMFARAVEWEIIPTHPFEHVDPPPDRRSTVPAAYTPAQLLLLYEHSKPTRAGELDYTPVWQFMVNTGLRRAEAVKAKRGDIVNGRDFAADLPDRPVLLVESTPDEEGEGGTKSGKLRRIPLNAQALAALERLGSDRLLPRIAKESLTRTFKRCAQAAGLAGSIHRLRHTFGTNLILNGVPVRVVQELMGHASITTTEKYAHMVQGSLTGAVDRIAL